MSTERQVRLAGSENRSEGDVDAYDLRQPGGELDTAGATVVGRGSSR